MKHNIVSRWATVVALVVTLVIGGLAAQTAVADIVGTETLLREESGAVTRDELQSLLARDDVQQQLIDYGVTPEQASERVAALTGAELQQLSRHMDDEPAGGSIALVLLIVILILVLR